VKERPILFSAPMVRAILDGSKSQTRRIVKPQPPSGHEFAGWVFSSTFKPDEEKATWSKVDSKFMLSDPHRVRCPYGKPGDRLWVRETFCPDWSDKTIYKADGGSAIEAGYKKEPRWTPSIHMPRWASRINLEITGIRVERLQDISEKDAIAEGISQTKYGCHIHFYPDMKCVTVEEGYRNLWESINGAGSWEVNPWVWVVEFKKVS